MQELREQDLDTPNHRAMLADDSQMLTQFYKREENQILFSIYNIVCQETNDNLVSSTGKQAVYFSYNDLCRKFNSKQASGRKRNRPTTDKINN